MADGHFGEHRLSVSINRADEEHLWGLACFLGPNFVVRQWFGSAGNELASLTCQDRVFMQQLRERFELSSRKTYEPPKRVPYEDVDILRSWFIGFIDGDGTIQQRHNRSTLQVSVVAHASWFDLLSSSAKRLGSWSLKLSDNGTGNAYVRVGIGKQEDLIALAQHAFDHGLPVLRRKWGKVNPDYVPGHASRDARVKAVRQRLAAGAEPSDIAIELGIKERAIQALRSRDFARARQRGKPAPYPLPRKVATAARAKGLIAEGRDDTEVARLTGMLKDSVRQMRLRLDAQTPVHA